MVKKSHPRGFIIKRLFHTEQMYLFLTLSLKITSGEISADEQQERAGAKQRNITDKKLSRQSAHQKRLQSLQKLFFKNQNQKKSIIQFRPSIHQPNHYPPHHPHPEERIWAGRTPRVPDAPKIKRDKMKQFYMIDMERKRW